MNNVLVVDGYNIIGAWEELKTLKDIDMAQARDRLIELMADYQAYSGLKIIIVYDAHYVKGKGSVLKSYDVEIIYTKENETADECIERIVTKYKTVVNQVYVATSDYLEQRVIFGRGALRKSARELFIELQASKKSIQERIEYNEKSKPSAKIPLNDELRQKFEQMRRRRN
ncbi:MAG TPA: NYN domain-containing protein [Bacillota bacterium]|nr:NYN domain-containing protein [Bacillota bacterium]